MLVEQDGGDGCQQVLSFNPWCRDIWTRKRFRLVSVVEVQKGSEMMEVITCFWTILWLTPPVCHHLVLFLGTARGWCEASKELTALMIRSQLVSPTSSLNWIYLRWARRNSPTKYCWTSKWNGESKCRCCLNLSEMPLVCRASMYFWATKCSWACWCYLHFPTVQTLCLFSLFHLGRFHQVDRGTVPKLYFYRADPLDLRQPTQRYRRWNSVLRRFKHMPSRPLYV